MLVCGDNDDGDDDDSDDKDDDGGQMTRWVVRFGESGKTVQLVVVNGSISYCTTRRPSSSSHPHDGGDDDDNDDNDDDDDLLLDNAQQIFVLTGREFWDANIATEIANKMQNEK